jgi:anti-sigma B factor antagonist
MIVSSTAANGTVIVAVQGEVDLYSSPRLREEIVHWAQKKVLTLIVDLGAVSYMDSSGIATLVEGLQLTRTYGGRFKIARPAPTIQEVFRFANLDKIFPVFGSVEDALSKQ